MIRAVQWLEAVDMPARSIRIGIRTTMSPVPSSPPNSVALAAAVLSWTECLNSPSLESAAALLVYTEVLIRP